MATDDLEDLLQGLKSDSVADVSKAAGKIGRLGAEDAIPTLIETYKTTTNKHIRSAIIWALIKMGGSGKQTLLDNMKSAHYELRIHSISVFPSIASKDDIPILLQQMQSSDMSVKSVAADSLRRAVSDDTCFIEIEELFDSEADDHIGSLLIQTFEVMGGEYSINKLISILLLDPRPKCRAMAAIVLGTFGNRLDVIEALGQACYNDQSQRVREYTRITLKRIGTVNAKNILENCQK